MNPNKELYSQEYIDRFTLPFTKDKYLQSIDKNFMYDGLYEKHKKFLDNLNIKDKSYILPVKMGMNKSKSATTEIVLSQYTDGFAIRQKKAREKLAQSVYDRKIKATIRAAKYGGRA